MIVFVDPYERKGGGQVVLERMLAHLNPAVLPPVVLCMPPDGRAGLDVPPWVLPVDDLHRLRAHVAGRSHALLVSNANASHLPTLRVARHLRSRGTTVATLAVVHNYPRSRAREVALRAILAAFDETVFVEPGLLRYRPTGRVLPWLAAELPRGVTEVHDAGARRTGDVKIFARPDPEKGLHLLPRVLPHLEALGLRCSVALGTSMRPEGRYAARLRLDLAPWLATGPRSASWLAPGDIFLSTSLSETTCLAVQEAMLRGAFAVASRVGLMPYLEYNRGNVTTFAAGSAPDCVRAVRELLDLDDEQFSAAVARGATGIRERQGLWYREVGRLIDVMASRESRSAVEGRCLGGEA